MKDFPCDDGDIKSAIDEWPDNIMKKIYEVEKGLKSRDIAIKSAIDEWSDNIMKKICEVQEGWIRSNLSRACIPIDKNLGMRCKIVQDYKFFRHTYMLYIDDKLVSILEINSATLEAKVENTDDGFKNSWQIK